MLKSWGIKEKREIPFLADNIPYEKIIDFKLDQQRVEAGIRLFD